MGFRILEQGSNERIAQLAREFPLVASLIDRKPFVISAYPAALGLSGVSTYVDTYMHATTFVRSCRLASQRGLPVVFVAQPIVGVEFLLQLVREGFEIPRDIFWVSGGYYLPVSLELFAKELMNRADCELEVIHSYGAAEVGHTCFAAISRSASGQPMYKKVSDDVKAKIDEFSSELTLSKNGISLATRDIATLQDGFWTISNSPSRLAASVKHMLESFRNDEWSRYTGRTNWSVGGQLVLQLRMGISVASDNERQYFTFWDQFNGGPSFKPKWGSEAG
ncbi:MAG: hypothetical protein AAFN77_18125 [Planctomycetota bacterium]